MITRRRELLYKWKFDPNGHEYVNLGLPSKTLWAKYNVGATLEGATGNYYKYGLGASAYDYTQANYTGTESPLSSSADTARQVMGGDWRMPTVAHVQELLDECTWVWDVMDGSVGYLITGQNGNSIFLPAAGFYDGGPGFASGPFAYYWTSIPDGSENACVFNFDGGNKGAGGPLARRFGFNVRGVISPTGGVILSYYLSLIMASLLNGKGGEPC